jgi:tRNA A37 threonylcarbamoyladenosine biosynthesis protein TsaE
MSEWLYHFQNYRCSQTEIVNNVEYKKNIGYKTVSLIEDDAA